MGGPQISFANRESAICGHNFFRFADLPQMWQFTFLGFAVRIFFAICEPNFLHNSANANTWFFILTSISIKMLSFKFRDDFWLLGQFWVTYYLVGKENIRGKRIWIRNTAFSLQIFGFAICRLGRQGNLPICDLQINRVTKKLENCNCGMSPRIGKLAIWELPTKFLCTPLRNYALI